MMFKFLLLTALAASVNSFTCREESVKAEIVCFYHGNLSPELLDPCKCTVLSISGLTLENDFQVSTDLDMAKIRNLKVKNPGLKILISVGGELVKPQTFVTIVSSPDLLTNFTNGVTNFVIQNKIDGVEIDWRWPGAPGSAKSRDDLTSLVKALRLILDEKREDHVISRRSLENSSSTDSGLSDWAHLNRTSSPPRQREKTLDQPLERSSSITETYSIDNYLEDSSPFQRAPDYLFLDDYETVPEYEQDTKIEDKEDGGEKAENERKEGHVSESKDGEKSVQTLLGGEIKAKPKRVDRGKIKFKDHIKSDDPRVLQEVANRQGLLGDRGKGRWRIASKRVIGAAEKVVRPLEKRVGDGKIIMLSISPRPEYIAKGYDLKALTSIVDIFSIPSDNLTSSYAEENATHYQTYHHSRLMGVSDIHNADSLIDLIVSMGVPLDRLIMGVPTTAGMFTLETPEETLPRSPTTGPPTWISYKSVCSYLEGGNWTMERDEDLTGTYTFSNTTWIAFDDPVSLRIKGKYALLRGLAGIGIQAIDDDDSLGSCSQGPFPLLTSVYEIFTRLARNPRKAVLRSLVRDLETAESTVRATYVGSSTDIRISPFRIVRVVDRTGDIRAVRSNNDVRFECSRQGYYRDPNDCSQFYRCVKFNQYIDDYTVFEYSCPPGLVFDDRWEICAWPSTAPPCDGSSEIFPVPRMKNICDREGYFVDPENCRWFFACKDYYGNGNFTLYEFRCPFGLAYDEENKICNWPWLVSSCGEHRSASSRGGRGKAIDTGASHNQNLKDNVEYKECVDCNNVEIVIRGEGVLHPDKGIIVSPSYFDQVEKLTNNLNSKSSSGKSISNFQSSKPTESTSEFNKYGISTTIGDNDKPLHAQNLKGIAESNFPFEGKFPIYNGAEVTQETDDGITQTIKHLNKVVSNFNIDDSVAGLKDTDLDQIKAYGKKQQPTLISSAQTSDEDYSYPSARPKSVEASYEGRRIQSPISHRNTPKLSTSNQNNKYGGTESSSILDSNVNLHHSTESKRQRGHYKTTHFNGGKAGSLVQEYNYDEPSIRFNPIKSSSKSHSTADSEQVVFNEPSIQLFNKANNDDTSTEPEYQQNIPTHSYSVKSSNIEQNSRTSYRYNKPSVHFNPFNSKLNENENKQEDESFRSKGNRKSGQRDRSNNKYDINTSKTSVSHDTGSDENTETDSDRNIKHFSPSQIRSEYANNSNKKKLDNRSRDRTSIVNSNNKLLTQSRTRYNYQEPKIVFNPVKEPENHGSGEEFSDKIITDSSNGGYDYSKPSVGFSHFSIKDEGDESVGDTQKLTSPTGYKYDEPSKDSNLFKSISRVTPDNTRVPDNLSTNNKKKPSRLRPFKTSYQYEEPVRGFSPFKSNSHEVVSQTSSSTQGYEYDEPSRSFNPFQSQSQDEISGEFTKERVAVGANSNSRGSSSSNTGYNNKQPSKRLNPVSSKTKKTSISDDFSSEATTLKTKASSNTGYNYDKPFTSFNPFSSKSQTKTVISSERERLGTKSINPVSANVGYKYNEPSKGFDSLNSKTPKISTGSEEVEIDSIPVIGNSNSEKQSSSGYSYDEPKRSFDSFESKTITKIFNSDEKESEGTHVTTNTKSSVRGTSRTGYKYEEPVRSFDPFGVKPHTKDTNSDEIESEGTHVTTNTKSSVRGTSRTGYKYEEPVRSFDPFGVKSLSKGVSSDETENEDEIIRSNTNTAESSPRSGYNYEEPRNSFNPFESKFQRTHSNSEHNENKKSKVNSNTEYKYGESSQNINPFITKSQKSTSGHPFKNANSNYNGQTGNSPVGITSKTAVNGNERKPSIQSTSSTGYKYNEPLVKFSPVNSRFRAKEESSENREEKESKSYANVKFEDIPLSKNADRFEESFTSSGSGSQIAKSQPSSNAGYKYNEPSRHFSPFKSTSQQKGSVYDGSSIDAKLTTKSQERLHSTEGYNYKGPTKSLNPFSSTSQYHDGDNSELSIDGNAKLSIEPSSNTGYRYEEPLRIFDSFKTLAHTFENIATKPITHKTIKSTKSYSTNIEDIFDEEDDEIQDRRHYNQNTERNLGSGNSKSNQGYSYDEPTVQFSLHSNKNSANQKNRNNGHNFRSGLINKNLNNDNLHNNHEKVSLIATTKSKTELKSEQENNSKGNNYDEPHTKFNPFKSEPFNGGVKDKDSDEVDEITSNNHAANHFGINSNARDESKNRYNVRKKGKAIIGKLDRYYSFSSNNANNNAKSQINKATNHFTIPQTPKSLQISSDGYDRFQEQALDSSGEDSQSSLKINPAFSHSSNKSPTSNNKAIKDSNGYSYGEPSQSFSLFNENEKKFNFESNDRRNEHDDYLQNEKNVGGVAYSSKSNSAHFSGSHQGKKDLPIRLQDTESSDETPTEKYAAKSLSRSHFGLGNNRQDAYNDGDKNRYTDRSSSDFTEAFKINGQTKGVQAKVSHLSQGRDDEELGSHYSVKKHEGELSGHRTQHNSQQREESKPNSSRKVINNHRGALLSNFATNSPRSSNGSLLKPEIQANGGISSLTGKSISNSEHSQTHGKNDLNIRNSLHSGPTLLSKFGTGNSKSIFGTGNIREIYDTLGPEVCERAGLFRHPTSCDKFYECYWDKWIEKFTLHIFDCPVTIVYDSQITACNWPFNGPPCDDDDDDYS